MTPTLNLPPHPPSELFSASLTKHRIPGTQTQGRELGEAWLHP